MGPQAKESRGAMRLRLIDEKVLPPNAIVRDTQSFRDFNARSKEQRIRYDRTHYEVRTGQSNAVNAEDFVESSRHKWTPEEWAEYDAMTDRRLKRQSDWVNWWYDDSATSSQGGYSTSNRGGYSSSYDGGFLSSRQSSNWDQSWSASSSTSRSTRREDTRQEGRSDFWHDVRSYDSGSTRDTRSTRDATPQHKGKGEKGIRGPNFDQDVDLRKSKDTRRR